MGYALKIYEAFRDLGEEKASILAEFVEYMESRKAATTQELKETELRLQKGIEQVRLEVEEVRKELKETELRLQKGIEEVRKELKETELRLQKEIEQVRKEISETKASLIKWMYLFWTGQLIGVAGLLKLMLH